MIKVVVEGNSSGLHMMLADVAAMWLKHSAAVQIEK